MVIEELTDHQVDGDPADRAEHADAGEVAFAIREMCEGDGIGQRQGGIVSQGVGQRDSCQQGELGGILNLRHPKQQSGSCQV